MRCVSSPADTSQVLLGLQKTHTQTNKHTHTHLYGKNLVPALIFSWSQRDGFNFSLRNAPRWICRAWRRFFRHGPAGIGRLRLRTAVAAITTTVPGGQIWCHRFGSDEFSPKIAVSLGATIHFRVVHHKHSLSVMPLGTKSRSWALINLVNEGYNMH